MRSQPTLIKPSGFTVCVLEVNFTGQRDYEVSKDMYMCALKYMQPSFKCT